MSCEGRAEGPSALLRPGAALGLLLLLILLPWYLFEDGVERWSAAALAGRGAPLALAGTLLLAFDSLLPVPSSVVAVTMGTLLGPIAGAAVNATGLTLGCLLGYGAGAAGRPLARRLLGFRAEAFERWMARYGIAALIVCRPVPILAEASMIVLGAGRARFLPAMGTAMLANISLGALYAFAGAAQGPDSLPGAPALAAAILVPALATIAAWLAIRRFDGKSRRS